MRKTEWRGQDCPPQYEVVRNGGMLQLVLYVGAREVESVYELEDVEQPIERLKEYVATRVEMPIGEFNYGAIVSALINAKYSSDQMQAIINNKLLGDGGHEEEYNEMQAWRKEAKELGKKIINTIGIGKE